MSPYLFSVVIPVLNEEKYLPKLLADLSKQKKKPPFEVIVVDGGSHDDTCKLAESFSDKLDLTVVSTKKNLSHQRNLGAQSAQGQYVVFIDADCRIASTFLFQLAQLIKKDQHLIFIPRIQADKKSQLNNLLVQAANYAVELSQYLGRPVTPGSCLIFQKGFFDFIGGFKVTRIQSESQLFSEDFELAQRCRKAGVVAKYLKKPVVTISLRRLQKEGRMSVFRKYLMNDLEIFTNGKLKFKEIEYEMGGQYYTSKRAKRG